jgi:hypothetical protein
MLESPGRVEARRSSRTVGVGLDSALASEDEEAGFCLRGAWRRGSTFAAGRACGFAPDEGAAGRDEDKLGVCTAAAGFSAGLGLGLGFALTLRKCLKS